jgi:hypothetical protein
LPDIVYVGILLLNQYIKVRHYPLPTIDDLFLELSNAKVFSVVDAKNGFWHVHLDEGSSYLITFNAAYQALQL